MFELSVPWWELVLRSALVFSFLILLLRLTGKRQIGQLSPMDLVLLLVRLVLLLIVEVVVGVVALLEAAQLVEGVEVKVKSFIL